MRVESYEITVRLASLIITYLKLLLFYLMNSLLPIDILLPSADTHQALLLTIGIVVVLMIVVLLAVVLIVGWLAVLL